MPLTAILIGFHGPKTEVAENDNGFGYSCFFDYNYLIILLESNTTTEIIYEIKVSYINGMGNAKVIDRDANDVDVDALFGTRLPVENHDYMDGTSVTVSIINDHQPEPTEFFQLSVEFLPTPTESGIAFPATCLNDDSEQFLCTHTVHILDDDSKYCKHSSHIVMIKILHSLSEQIIMMMTNYYYCNFIQLHLKLVLRLWNILSMRQKQW